MVQAEQPGDDPIALIAQEAEMAQAAEQAGADIPSVQLTKNISTDSWTYSDPSGWHPADPNFREVPTDNSHPEEGLFHQPLPRGGSLVANVQPEN